MQKSFREDKPTLYLVSTPIGNLKDMTYRAVEILQSVDTILCEDTRTSSVLLNHYKISKPLLSYHEFNKMERETEVINMLKEGKNLALISDAGTPGISDPGFEITESAIAMGYHVVSIPGASAILAALVVSGLMIQPFTFIGFLPRKQGERTKLLKTYETRHETLLFYESPLRVEKTIESLYEAFGNRKVTLARELTKTFETIIRTTLKEALTIEHQTKGEYVIILEGYQKKIDSKLTLKDQVEAYIKQGLDEKEAMKQVAKDQKITKSDVYKAFKINA
ncbi:MAG: 16S rRNA (cytidine(1402)-2'-O)-methyltransferase [Tenericutes bacterium HGW-Tenericutes-6]|nr:MAG: 16S rRNA (cytidine(1402)-2'-O)-methyltransferase [Tenericutes bacterium HGW-Tenericutes-6]